MSQHVLRSLMAGALGLCVALSIAPSAAGQHFSDCFSTTTNATLLVPETVSASLGSSGDGLSDGDEIALFTGEGQCAGVGVWQNANLAIAIAGANSQESAGYEEGQSLRFRVWDASAQVAYEPDASFTSCQDGNPLCRGDGLYEPDAFYTLSSLIAAAEGPPPDDDTDPPATTVPVAAVTASDEQVPNVAGNTLDDDLSTRWSANGSGVQVLYELASEVTLEEVAIAWYGGDERQATFRIDASTDGSSWTTVHEGSSSGTTAQLEPYPFSATPARYVRITGYGNTQNTWTSITEVDIRSASADNPPPEIVNVTDVVATTEQAPNVAGNTLDDDLATRWSANGSGVQILYELASEVTLDEVAIAWYGGDERQADFRVDASTDGSSWTTVHEGSSSGSTRQLEPYSVSATPARYVRITGYGNTQNTWTSITEVAIWGTGGGSAPPEPIAVAGVTASKEQHPNVAGNTRDSDLATRWSAKGFGVHVQYELVSEATLDQLGIAWYRGDERQAHFEVALSTDGTTWTTVHDGSSSGSTMGLEYYSFAATPARHVRITGLGNTENTWTSITEVTFDEPDGGSSPAMKRAIDQPIEEVITELALDANYPNPFGTATTIEYALPEPTHVVLEVFDILGRRIARLVDQERPAGRHRVRVDASDWTSGTYLYRLRAAGETRTGRMTVIR